MNTNHRAASPLSVCPTLKDMMANDVRHNGRSSNTTRASGRSKESNLHKEDDKLLNDASATTESVYSITCRVKMSDKSSENLMRLMMEVGNLIVLSKISLNTASALNGRSRTLVN
jgi:hypothetical protein